MRLEKFTHSLQVYIPLLDEDDKSGALPGFANINNPTVPTSAVTKRTPEEQTEREVKVWNW